MGCLSILGSPGQLVGTQSTVCWRPGAVLALQCLLTQGEAGSVHPFLP